MSNDVTEELPAFGGQDTADTAEITNSTENVPHIRVAMIGLRGIAEGLGGVETAVREISVRLAADGIDVTCFCRNRYNDESELDGIKLVNIPAPPFKHTETAIYALQAALKASFDNFDIIHIHALTSSLMAWIPLLMSNKKIVVTIHGLDWQRDKWGPLARSILLRGEWCAMRLPHCTVCVSKSNRQYLLNKYPCRHIECIPNGCNLPPDPPAPPEELEDNYILAMGRLVPEKGIHRLIKAYRNIDTSTKLVIAGGEGHCSKYRKKLEQLASDDNRIVFTGMITGDRKERFLANARLFVLPSTLEGHPVSLIEACSRGVCPLVSRIPEAVEILGGVGDTAKNIFDPRSVNDIASTIDYYLTNQQEADNLGKLAAQHVLATYTWDQTATRTLDLYLRLMGFRP